jgi:hypothetical protein
MAKKKWISISGERGTWSAKVTWEDGSLERLPCAHKYFWTKGKHYFDPLNWSNGGPPVALREPKLQRCASF